MSTEQITTAAELDAMPDVLYMPLRRCAERNCTSKRYSELTDDQNTHWHRDGTVLYRPDAPARTEPQRVAPGEDELHAILSGILFNYGDEDPDDLGARLARNVLHACASQPTVAEVRAQALDPFRELAHRGVRVNPGSVWTKRLADLVARAERGEA